MAALFVEEFLSYLGNPGISGCVHLYMELNLAAINQILIIDIFSVCLHIFVNDF